MHEKVVSPCLIVSFYLPAVSRRVRYVRVCDTATFIWTKAGSYREELGGKHPESSVRDSRLTHFQTWRQSFHGSLGVSAFLLRYLTIDDVYQC